MQFKLLLTFAIICSAFAQIEINTDDTDSPDPTTTSTSTSTTTTTTTTTTTSTTTSTTTEAPEPKTTTAAPSSSYLYNVTENNVTCILLDGNLSFKITYNNGGNNTNTTVVSVPKPSDSTRVEGSCGNNQKIKIFWGDAVQESYVELDFSLSEDKKMWSILSISSQIQIDSTNFYNASNEGSNLVSEVNLETSPAEVPVNHSFKCFSTMVFNNVTTTMEDAPYNYPVVFSVDGVQLQAYNKIAQESKFVEEIHCSADKIADIVPIAVGSALAALVVTVLIAYVIGRRRRSAAYHSV